MHVKVPIKMLVICIVFNYLYQVFTNAVYDQAKSDHILELN